MKKLLLSLLLLCGFSHLYPQDVRVQDNPNVDFNALRQKRFAYGIRLDMPSIGQLMTDGSLWAGKDNILGIGLGGSAFVEFFPLKNKMLTVGTNFGYAWNAYFEYDEESDHEISIFTHTLALDLLVGLRIPQKVFLKGGLRMQFPLSSSIDEAKFDDNLNKVRFGPVIETGWSGHLLDVGVGFHYLISDLYDFGKSQTYAVHLILGFKF